MLAPLRILNIMLGRGLGGIEQAFLDYHKCLTLAGHEVVAVSHPKAAVNSVLASLQQTTLDYHTLFARGEWDILAAWRIGKLCRYTKPDAIISHGNRALGLVALALRLQRLSIPHLSVTHNYKLRRFSQLDAVLATTEDLRQAAMSQGVAANHIYLLPNMVRLPAMPTPQPLHTPLVIGAMGRMVEKKGFHLLLEAAAILKSRGIAFHLTIGGKGEQEAALHQQCHALNLEQEVSFIGWVQDKATFFQEIDLFCLPSLHEPFGIVMLEAMAFACPVVAFASEGPREIAPHGEVRLVATGDVTALADALAQSITHPESLATQGIAGRNHVAKHYDLPIVSKQLDGILREIIAGVTA
jgi:glycosyltransferase involved in cell wall biosynthesis